MVLLDLEGNELFQAIWSWEGGFKAIDKNILRSFKCKHTKNNGCFFFKKKIGVTIKVDWVERFWGFVGATCKHHQKPPDIGRGGAHLSFGFNFAQFRGP